MMGQGAYLLLLQLLLQQPERCQVQEASQLSSMAETSNIITTIITTDLEFKNLLHFANFFLLPLNLFSFCLLLHKLVVLSQNDTKLLVQLPHHLQVSQYPVIVSHRLLLVIIELFSSLQVHPVLLQLALQNHWLDHVRHIKVTVASETSGCVETSEWSPLKVN
ncbi:hypothetical protein E2C01_009328 [Portunus trituberculatus]|uniref:Uncharacterized protein n=1 Tax=Portunus trituberculatus TaxID=210409 RepID=A0A5B7D5F9_PORTR|nr:hypothetical protein [Portunus trituberculatus]